MDTIYQASDGRYYSETELWQQYESGEWAFCAGEASTGQEVVRTDRGALLLLTPIRDVTLGVADGTATEEGYVDHVPPLGHCPDCGERLLSETCGNCETRAELESRQD